MYKKSGFLSLFLSCVGMHNLHKITLFRLLLFITYPFALLFLYPITLLKKRSKGRIFFFFDRYAIGGAQRIHLDILNSIADADKMLFFTRVSQNNALKDEFYSIPHTVTFDIHFWCDNLLFRIFSVHYYSFYVNRHKGAHVFSSNSTFFYDMLPFLNKTLVKTELLHNFTHGKNGMEFFGLANCKYLNYRIVYDTYTLNNIKRQYEKYQIPEGFLKKILFIEPGVMIPVKQEKNHLLPLKVLYAGRGGAQKRIYLLGAIAQKCIEQKLPVEFHFAGTMMDELSDFVKAHSVIHGTISQPEEMYDLYKSCDAILLTSAYEGFPMLIKESMACGCVPIVTALEGNKTHLRHMENALLISNPENETEVIEEGITNIKMLVENAALRQKLSDSAYNYAVAHFNKEAFVQTYRKFFAL